MLGKNKKNGGSVSLIYYGKHFILLQSMQAWSILNTLLYYAVSSSCIILYIHSVAEEIEWSETQWYIFYFYVTYPVPIQSFTIVEALHCSRGILNTMWCVLLSPSSKSVRWLNQNRGTHIARMTVTCLCLRVFEVCVSLTAFHVYRGITLPSLPHTKINPDLFLLSLVIIPMLAFCKIGAFLKIG